MEKGTPSELRKFLNEKQCGLLFRELLNFGPHVCSVKSPAELVIYNFILSKTVYFHRISERFTLEYCRRGHSGHCIRAFPRTRWSFRRALKSLEERAVITVTRTDHPNWFEARLELPGLLSRILAAPVGYENPRSRELLVFALDRTKRWWEARKWKLRAVRLRPEIEKLQIDFFDAPPPKQVAADRMLDLLRRKMHKLCLRHKIEFAWHVVGKTMTESILRGYHHHLLYCKAKKLDNDKELDRLVGNWSDFVASKPTTAAGLRLSVSPKLRMADFFIYQGALRRWIRKRPFEKFQFVEEFQFESESIE
jgi:hypothetical protein